MSKWKVIQGRDAEGNECIYLQDGSDKQTLELYKFMPPDSKILFIFQYEINVEEAQHEARKRNAKDA